MQERLEVCASICQDIVRKTISSNDLFPHRGVSFSNFIRLSLNVSKFGEIRFNLLANYLANYHQITQCIKEFFKTHPSEYAIQIASLAMLRMGVGESNILCNGVFLQLVKNHPEFNFGLISIKNQSQEKHYFILIAEEMPEIGENYAHALSTLPEDAIVIDPFLNYVGPANHYCEAHHEFLSYHGYEQILDIHAKTIYTPEQFAFLEEQCERTFQFLKSKNIHGFLSREFLDLALTGYSCTQRKVKSDARLIAHLKTTSLPFFGMYEERTKQLDAVSEITTPEQQAIAQSIQGTLHAGCFFVADKKSFFVIPAIEGTDSLVQEISTQYPLRLSC